MAEVIAHIKKKYQEFGEKHCTTFHGKRCNTIVDIVEVKKQVGSSSHTHCEIGYTDLFRDKSNDGRAHTRVLVDGYKGTGKTFLCTTLCVDWANGTLLQHFSLLLFIPLHHEKVISAGSLPNLLKHLFPQKHEQAIIKGILNKESDKVLIIADGWNHLQKYDRQEGSFVHQLLFGPLLPQQVSVLITSTPSASVQLHDLQCIDQFIEIHGFNRASISQYMNCVLATDKACRLLNQLQHNKKAEALCSIPLNCAILGHLWHTFDMEIVPMNITDLYTGFVSNMIVCSVKKDHPHHQNLQLSITAFPDDIQKYFWQWCEFAFQSLETKTAIFSHQALVSCFPQCSDEIRSCFGLLQPIELPFDVLNVGKKFQFLHSNILEYLASLYLARQEVDTQLEIICESHTELIIDSDTICKFYFGLARESQNEENLQMIQIFIQIVSQKLTLCHCAYEADSDLVNSVVAGEICGKFLFPNMKPQTTYDYSVIAHVLFHTRADTNTQISLNSCGLTDTQLVQLADNLGSKLRPLKVTTLDLCGNMLTHIGIQNIFQRVLSTYHLTHLDLSHNPVEVEGLQILEDAVSENMLKNVQKLILRNCLTSDSDINGALLTTFSGAVLNHCSNLRYLDLSENNLGVSGAQALSQAISSHPNLSLSLNNTALGDDGIKAFAQANWTLDKLELRENSLHAVGISSLVDSISSGQCIVCSLVLDDNPLSLEGSRALGKILSGSSSCSELSLISLSRCHLTGVNATHKNSTAQDIAQELFHESQNNAIEELHLDENDFAGEGIHVLAGFLYLCPKLKYIFSSRCGISSTEVKCLAHHLPSLEFGWSGLKIWNLEYNMIDDSVIWHLAVIILNTSTHLDNNLISHKMEKKIWLVSC